VRYSYVDPAPVAEAVEPRLLPRPWPAPEVPARVVALGDPEVSTGPRRLARAASKAGWAVVATYARGTDPGKRVPRVVDSLALRMRRSERRAVAVWHDGEIDTAWLWGDRPFTPCAVTELREALT
jgi:hypothetical protein